MHGMVRDMAWQECQEKIALFIKGDRWSTLIEKMTWSRNDVILGSQHTRSPHKSLASVFIHRRSISLEISPSYPISGLWFLRILYQKHCMLHSFHWCLLWGFWTCQIVVLHELPTEIGQLINLEYLNDLISLILLFPICHLHFRNW